MNLFEQVGRGDIGKIERRILSHQDHVEARQLGALRLAQREVIAQLIAHLERLHGGKHTALRYRKPVRSVVVHRMAAFLRLQQQRESRIAADVDPLDRVHLNRDGQGHEISLNPDKQRKRVVNIFTANLTADLAVI